MIIRKLIRALKRINIMAANIDVKLDCSIRANYLLNLALTSKEAIAVEKSDNDKELIVSFTTYNKRIHNVHLVIESIAYQTVKPNRLILWLDEDEFTLDNIPLILHKQIERGLEVRFCPNYKSYKKLIPTLELFPDADIITIDDDILYPHDMIEGLVKEHQQYPDCIIGHRAHKITYDKKGYILPYRKWSMEVFESSDNGSVFITTGAGTIFPAKCFLPEALRSDIFLKICPNADDVWFNAMAALNAYKTKKVADERDFWTRFLLLESTQDIALAISNVSDGGNDTQIENVFKKYDIYKLL